MREFFVTFIALFVAVDIVGVLPVYLGFVAALDVEARQRITMEATLTATGIGIGFLLLGDAVLRIVGVGEGAMPPARMAWGTKSMPQRLASLARRSNGTAGDTANTTERSLRPSSTV